MTRPLTRAEACFIRERAQDWFVDDFVREGFSESATVDWLAWNAPRSFAFVVYKMPKFGDDEIDEWVPKWIESATALGVHEARRRFDVERALLAFLASVRTEASRGGFLRDAA